MTAHKVLVFVIRQDMFGVSAGRFVDSLTLTHIDLIRCVM